MWRGSCLILLFLSSATALAQRSRLDQHGDPLPRGALARFGTLRLRHTDTVQSLALSPDGKTIASGSADHTIALWHSASGKLLRRLKFHSEDVTALAFSPDGKILASGSDDSWIGLWNLTSGTLIGRCGGDGPYIKSLCFSPDGRSLASAGGDGLLRLWDWARRMEIRRFSGHAAQVKVVVFSPDGKRLASGDTNAVVRIWSVARGVELLKFSSHSGDVRGLGFLQAGKLIASAGDRTIRLWESKTGKQRRVIQGQGLVHSMALSHDGKSLAIGGARGSLKVWNLETGKLELKSADTVHAVRQLLFSADDRSLICAVGNAIQLRDRRTGAARFAGRGHTSQVFALTISADGTTLATAGDDRRIRLWELNSGKQRRIFAPHQSDIWSLAFLRDAKTLVSGGQDNGIRFWDYRSGKQVFVTSARTQQVLALQLSPDGRTLASGGDGQEALVLWDPASRKPRIDLAKLPKKVRTHSLAFSPGGRYLAAGQEQRIELVDVRSGKSLMRLEGYSGTVFGVAISPDGGTLVSASAGTLHFWDLASGKLVRRVKGPGPAYSVAISRDGRRIATGGRNGLVRIWDARTGGLLGQFAGHRGGVWEVRFGLKSDWLFTLGEDTTVLAWDLNAVGLKATAPLARPVAADLHRLWLALSSDDALAANQAAWALARGGREVVAYLGQRLSGLGGVPAERVARLIELLDARRYRTRQKASKALLLLGPEIAPRLEKTLAARPSLEVRTRIRAVLREFARCPFARSGMSMAALRAIHVLSRIGSPEAGALLAKLGKGPARRRVTQDARAAAGRIARQGK